MSHIFSIYFADLSKKISGKKQGVEIEIIDRELIKRLADVLRLHTEETFLLFDEKQNIEFIVLKKEKKKLHLKIISISENKKIKPEIILCCGLLKKKHFEDVLYLASVMAVGKICPLLTSQVHKNWFEEKTIERLQKILISACEQSKNFILPELQNPVELKTFIEKEPFGISKKVCFHIDGESLFELLSDLNQKKHEKIYLFFGPEGDFTSYELNLFKQAEIEFYKLTQTILRSVEAVAVGLGSVRSI
ncbi:MAG: RsmE family RNA methyltransferase [bacterium]